MKNPGDWATDRAGSVYYIPREGEVMSQAQVVIPQQPLLLQATGLSNVAFIGIRLMHTDWEGAAKCGQRIQNHTGQGLVLGSAGINANSYGGFLQRLPKHSLRRVQFRAFGNSRVMVRGRLLQQSRFP